MIRLILAEDHPIVRNGIKSQLEAEEDIQVIGEAANGNQVLELLAGGTVADLVLTDITMPGMDGLELIKRIRKDFPTVAVLVLSMMDGDKFIFESFELGARGYVLKNATIEELVFYLRQVAEGHQVICNELGIKMLRRASHGMHSLDPVLALSERELEILDLISEGYTNQEIADRVFVSRRTVEGHRQSLVAKAGVRNTAQLVRFACKNGLI